MEHDAHAYVAYLKQEGLKRRVMTEIKDKCRDNYSRRAYLKEKSKKHTRFCARCLVVIAVEREKELLLKRSQSCEGASCDP